MKNIKFLAEIGIPLKLTGLLSMSSKLKKPLVEIASQNEIAELKHLLCKRLPFIKKAHNRKALAFYLELVTCAPTRVVARAKVIALCVLPLNSCYPFA